MSPDAIERLVESLANPVVESNIDCSLGSTVARSNAIDISENIVEKERIGELREIDFRKERHDTLNAFSEIGRHRSLAITDDAFMFESHQNIRCSGARTCGNGECMLKL